jgi:hypothetical protein
MRILNDMAWLLTIQFSGAMRELIACANLKPGIRVNDNDFGKFLSLLGKIV